MTGNDYQYYIEGVLKGDRRIIAKTITLIESALPRHHELGRKIIDRLLPYTGNSIRIGITGVPGVGKSTFIESFGLMLLNKKHKVAVLAVDPSSTKSGGSILADKTRMEKLSIEKMAYIRPSPSGGTLGGVARKTREAMLICEAAGFDVLIIETVGVGQSETTVSSMVDFFLVLMLAGAGDQLQGIKKGILELADAIVINKADGDNLEKAKMAQKEYQAAVHLFTSMKAKWKSPVLTCSALKTTGIEKIWDTVLEHKAKLTNIGELELKRKKQAVDWMWFLIEDGLRKRFYSNPDVVKQLSKVKMNVENGIITPTIAAMDLLFLLDNTKLV